MILYSIISRTKNKRQKARSKTESREFFTIVDTYGTFESYSHSQNNWLMLKYSLARVTRITSLKKIFFTVRFNISTIGYDTSVLSLVLTKKRKQL